MDQRTDLITIQGLGGACTCRVSTSHGCRGAAWKRRQTSWVDFVTNLFRGVGYIYGWVSRSVGLSVRGTKVATEYLSVYGRGYRFSVLRLRITPLPPSLPPSSFSLPLSVLSVCVSVCLSPISLSHGRRVGVGVPTGTVRASFFPSETRLFVSETSFFLSETWHVVSKTRPRVLNS